MPSLAANFMENSSWILKNSHSIRVFSLDYENRPDDTFSMWKNYSEDCFQIIGKARFLFYFEYWNLSTSKPKGRFCVDRNSSFSHLQ